MRQAGRVKRGAANLTVVTMASILLLGMSAPSNASAAGAHAGLWEECATGFAAGQCFGPTGIATDPTTGNVYIADSGGHRVNEFTIWGIFVKSWGWGVRTGAAELQSCTAQSGCQRGIDGSGVGQFSEPLDVAVDSSGDVYVLDRLNLRVQKFDPSGSDAEFVLTFGGEVNATKVGEPGASEAQRNLCPAASGDICQAGTSGNGAGQFAGWSAYSNTLAEGPGDTLYVGDTERIQHFNSAGEYLGSVPLPGERVQSLAVDRTSGVNAGDIYVARCNPATSCSQGINSAAKPGVMRLSAAGVEEDEIAEPTNPHALAVDGEGNLYVADGVGSGAAQTEDPQVRRRRRGGAGIPLFRRL